MKFIWATLEEEHEVFIPLHHDEEGDMELVASVTNAGLEMLGYFDSIGLPAGKELIKFMELLCEIDHNFTVTPSAREMTDAINAYLANPFPLPPYAPKGIFVKVTRHRKGWKAVMAPPSPTVSHTPSPTVKAPVRTPRIQEFAAPKPRAFTFPAPRPKWF